MSNTSVPLEHILTIVIEDYYQVGSFQHLIPNEYWGRFESRLTQNVNATLDLLDNNDSTATFFVCGWIAENYPQIIKKIAEKGHEVGCQGYYHHSIDDLPAQQFIEDIKRSKHVLERLLGKEVKGFRLARGWLKPSQLWLLKDLADMGFKYDSSLTHHGFHFVDKPQWGEIHQHTFADKRFYEVPVSSKSFFGWSMPIAGGNYWRQFPVWPFNRWIEKWMAKHQQPLVSYFHIWELDPQQPVISAASRLQKIRHYRNLATMKDKVQHYLQRYRFASIAKHLDFKDTLISFDQPDITQQDKHVVDIQFKGDITLVIPCYNEQQSLDYLKNTLASYAQSVRQSVNLHYIFIDDGSTDHTWKMLNSLFGQQSNTQLLQHQKNQGIAAALLTGFAQVQTDLLAVLDADCTFAPSQLTQMLNLMTGDVDVVSASPMHNQGAMHNVALWRQSMSKGAAFLHSLVMHHKLTSYTSCFRIYRRKAVKNLTLSNHGFCGVTEILAKIDLAGFKIVEYPATLETRLLGDSKINVAKTMFEHLLLVIKIGFLRLTSSSARIELEDEDEHKAK